MLESISFNNFKCFSSKKKIAAVDIKPLTLFYGFNNSGKSALMRGICMAMRSLNKELLEPLDRSTPSFSPQMRFEEITTQNSSNRLSLKMSIKQENELFELEWGVVGVHEYETYKVNEFMVSSSSGKLHASWELDEAEDRPSDNYRITINDGNSANEQLVFRGLLPASSKPEIQSLLPDAKSKQHLWLNSNRKGGTRRFDIEDTASLEISADGSGYANVLYETGHRSKARSELFEAVSSFFLETFDQRLFVEPVGKQFELKLGFRDTPYRVNVCDSGQGLQELLPIVTALNLFTYNTSLETLLIEEPESHLHPKFHQALGVEMCRVVADTNSPKLLLETHSQNLMLSIQLEIAKGNIDANNVVAYWIRPDGTGLSIVEKVDFDEKGRPSKNWPPNVFANDVIQARELFDLQRKQG